MSIVIDARKTDDLSNEIFKNLHSVLDGNEIAVKNTFVEEMENILGMDPTVDFNGTDCWNSCWIDEDEDHDIKKCFQLGMTFYMTSGYCELYKK